MPMAAPIPVSTAPTAALPPAAPAWLHRPARQPTSMTTWSWPKAPPPCSAGSAPPPDDIPPPFLKVRTDEPEPVHTPEPYRAAPARHCDRHPGAGFLQHAAQRALAAQDRTQ